MKVKGPRRRRMNAQPEAPAPQLEPERELAQP
jgi:hypothetical protein